MKRQQSLLGFGFVKKIPRIDTSEQQSTKDETFTSSAVIDGENAAATNDVQTVQCCDKQMLFQTVGAMNSMTISGKNMMG